MRVRRCGAPPRAARRCRRARRRRSGPRPRSKPLVLDPLDPGAEQLGGHDDAPSEVSAARSDGLRRCSGSRCSGTGCRRSSPGPRRRWGRGCRARPAVIVVRKPGVQKPHCRPWHSLNACCTGPSEPSRRSASPSTVVISASVGGDREHQAGAHRPPVEQDRAGAADAVLAADVGAGEAAGRGAARRRAAGAPAPRRRGVAPLTCSRTSWSSSLIGGLPAPRVVVRRRQHAAGQHPDQLGAVVGGGVDVVGRARASVQRRVAAGSRRRRRRPVRSTTVGHVADREVADPRRDDPSPSTGRRARRPRTARSRRAGGRSPRRPTPCPAARAGKNAATASSSCASDDSSGPAKRSAAAMVRGPRARPTSTEPPSSRSTTGISAAASACTIEPTVVPRLRMVGWATSGQRQREQRLTRAASVVGEHVGVPGQRTDADPVGVDARRSRGPGAR